MGAEKTIPIFPLGVVLMPTMFLPLHIFEERYKLMIGECLETGQDFGIVYFSSKQMKRVGCSAQILKVMRHYQNGEMDILTIGKSRFLIKEVYDAKAYLEAKIVHFDDEPEAEDAELTRLASEGINFLHELNAILGTQLDDAAMDRSDLKRISFLISSNDGFTPSEKQKLLEMTSTKRRLSDSVLALRKVIQRAQLTREIEKTIRGNGDLKKLLTKYGIKETTTASNKEGIAIELT
ncbi:MAG: LON peptidase substrate-binding domain-containing protein [Desulfatiglandaceae bacterium]